jgi:NADH-quinone oxidoreductase subunit C
MFGVRFTGNPDLSPLFLHNWKDIPPLRKDFNTVEYAGEAYGLGGDEGGAQS